jgi:hypothetical protein
MLDSTSTAEKVHKVIGRNYFLSVHGDEQLVDPQRISNEEVSAPLFQMQREMPRQQGQGGFDVLEVPNRCEIKASFGIPDKILDKVSVHANGHGC